MLQTSAEEIRLGGVRGCSLRPSGRPGNLLAISTSLQVENRHDGGNPEFIKAPGEEEKRA
jgi:hypothetical protein